MSAVPDTRTAPPRRSGASMALSVHAALSILLCVLVAVVWAAAGGGEFWPVWAWFALAILLAIHALVFDARRRPPAPEQALLVHAQVTGLVGAILIVVWALAGFGTFWPAWAMFGLALALGAHAIVVAPRPAAAGARARARRARRRADRAPGAARSTCRPPSCAASSATSTTARRRGSSR